MPVVFPPEVLPVFYVMAKFKVGDEVVTKKFDSVDNGIQFKPEMTSLVGESGKICKVGKEGSFFVNGWFWPESALTLVQPTADDFKPGEEVEVANSALCWLPYVRKFIGTRSDGYFVVEHERGAITAWPICRRPQPKMQKWNVWALESGLCVEKEGVTLAPYTIVHTFELPA